MVKPRTLKFEPSARIQGLFGRELISNDYVAIAETVRNSYDAGAKEITITLSPNNPQKFTILDTGTGMSTTEFQKVWMTPGYSEKSGSTEQEGGRRTLGEKGIGRFAVDKLASKLVVTTKKENRKAISAIFDWTKFENQNTKLKDIGIPFKEVEDEELNKQGQGTRLELINLRKVWTETDWNNLRNELKKILSPSDTIKKFKIIANAKGWESGEIKPNFNGQEAYYYFFSINKKGQILWTLTRPDKIIEKLKEKDITVPKTDSKSDLTENKFGFISGHFYFFEKPALIKNQGYDYGVGIYRDGFRVEPYGSKEDDWLGVKSKRASRQGHAPITPSRLFGYIEISRENNPNLIDLTNREGIQESEEFYDFQEKVKDRFEHFANFISEDNKILPVSGAITAQRRKGDIKTKAQAFEDMAAQLAHQLRQPMNHIKNTVTLLQTYVNKTVKNDENIQRYSERIQRNIDRLDSNIKGLTILAGNLNDALTEINLNEVLTDLYSINKPNFDHSGISLLLTLNLPQPIIKFSRAALEFVLDVYLENALKATIRSKKNHQHSVTLKVTEGQESNKIRISVEDSGDGIPRERLGVLFNKLVLSSDGQGAGLYFSKINIEQFEGKVGCENLPEGGAVFFVEI
ncbi:MAG TPA: sensor histidine kinase [Pyrinomonadaceae bacterium]|jgi:signal transduction histidine kinase